MFYLCRRPLNRNAATSSVARILNTHTIYHRLLVNALVGTLNFPRATRSQWLGCILCIRFLSFFLASRKRIRKNMTGRRPALYDLRNTLPEITFEVWHRNKRLLWPLNIALRKHGLSLDLAIYLRYLVILLLTIIDFITTIGSFNRISISKLISLSVHKSTRSKLMS